MLGRQVRLVSFDVFESALLRQLVDPDHIHFLTAGRLGLTNDEQVAEYVAARNSAEVNARKKAADAGRTEIGIAEISSELKDMLRTGLASKQPIQIELALEQELTIANPDILSLHRKARADDLSVAFIADTCLPFGVVAKMLRSAGYDWDYLFLSSQTGRTKKDGGLFTSIVEQTPFEPHQIAHVGDQQVAGLPIATTSGLGVDYSDGLSKLVAGRQQDLPRRLTGVDSVALSLAATHKAKVADKLTPADVGYYSLGPLLSGFTSWLCWVTRSKRPDHVVFTSKLDLGAKIVERIGSPLAERIRASDGIWQETTGDTAAAMKAFIDDNSVLPGDEIAIADLGWDDRNIAHFESLIPNDLDISVSGYCIGLANTPTTNTKSWAFGSEYNQELAARIQDSSLITWLCAPRSEAGFANTPVQPLVDQIAIGSLAFAEDIAPWVGHSPTTASLCWPALRTIEAPTYAEAQRLTDGWTTRDRAVAFNSSSVESAPLRSRLVRSLESQSEAIGGQHLGVIWAQGSHVLESGGLDKQAPTTAHRRLALRSLRFGQRRSLPS